MTSKLFSITDFKKFKTHLRLTEGEYQKLVNEHEKSGKGLAQLLKDAYFTRKTRHPVFQGEENLKIQKEFRRIGIFLNTIAKNINSGHLENWDKKVQDVQEQLTLLCTYLRGRHGRS